MSTSTGAGNARSSVSALFAALLLLPLPAIAQDTLPQPVEKWFAALRSVDRIAFGELMAKDAVIELRSLKFSQTREEFIAALDNWQELAGDTEITARPVSVGDGSTTVQVCYRRPSEAWTNLEVIRHRDGFVTGAVQERIAEDCAGFD